MLNERQTQLLRDMGISVWFTRSATREETPVAAAAPTHHSGVAEVRAALAQGPTATAQVPPVQAPPLPAPPLQAPQVKTAPVQAVTGQAPSQQVSAHSAPVAAESLQLLAFRSGHWLLLSAVPENRSLLRFAQDIVAAACRTAQLPGVEGTASATGAVLFEWPQFQGQTGTFEGALRAFINKQYIDAPARCLLLCTDVAARVKACIPEGVALREIPELAALSLDPQAKRALWLALPDLHAHAVRNTRHSG